MGETHPICWSLRRKRLRSPKEKGLLPSDCLWTQDHNINASLSLCLLPCPSDYQPHNGVSQFLQINVSYTHTHTHTHNLIVLKDTNTDMLSTHGTAAFTNIPHQHFSLCPQLPVRTGARQTLPLCIPASSLPHLPFLFTFFSLPSLCHFSSWPEVTSIISSLILQTIHVTLRKPCNSRSLCCLDKCNYSVALTTFPLQNFW